MKTLAFPWKKAKVRKEKNLSLTVAGPALAEYLYTLLEDETKYGEYFAWRKDYSVHRCLSTITTLLDLLSQHCHTLQHNTAIPVNTTGRPCNTLLDLTTLHC